VRVALAQPSVVGFASKLGEKERGDEKNFFNKEDEKLLKGLLKKMTAQAKAAEQPATQVSADALKDLFKKHKIDEAANKEFFQALIDWKTKI
jgi:hypothetical protein